MVSVLTYDLNTHWERIVTFQDKKKNTHRSLCSQAEASHVEGVAFHACFE